MPLSLYNPQVNVNYQTPNLMGNVLNTLQGINTARQGFLQNQAAQAQLPYVGPQAGANLGLTQAQAQYFPLTATGQFLTGVGRAIPAIQPFSWLRNAPEQVRDVGAANQIQGGSNVGAVPIPNYGGLSNSIMGIIGNALGRAPGAQQPQNATPMNAGSVPMSGLSNNDATTQALQNGSLPLSPQQQQQLQRFFPGSSAQTNQLVGNLNQQAQNSVATGGLIQKYNYAKNVATTLKTLQDDYGYPAISFAPYMGAKGVANLVADKAKVAAGQNVPQYQKYSAFVNTLPILKDQITQFFGASITPQAQEELDRVVDPATWNNNPSAAMMAYNTLTEILRTEGQTAAQTAGKTDEYNSAFPQFNASDAYQQLAKNPSIASNVFSVMSPSQQMALRAEHLRLKGGG